MSVPCTFFLERDWWIYSLLIYIYEIGYAVNHLNFAPIMYKLTKLKWCKKHFYIHFITEYSKITKLYAQICPCVRWTQNKNDAKMKWFTVFNGTWNSALLCWIVVLERDYLIMIHEYAKLWSSTMNRHSDFHFCMKLFSF